MKKIIFLFTLILGIVMISSYKQSALTESGEKHAIPPAPKELKGINKQDALQSKTNGGTSNPQKTTAEKPRILLLLTNDTGRSGWSPFLWWSYQHSNPGQAGC